jgi:secreted PhoX family phosphatase
MVSRRTFLVSTGLAAFAAPLHAFQERLAGGHSLVTGGYGPLAPVTDMATGLPLLELPEGFRYLSFGWTRDPMSNGAPTPARHDGMAAFAAKDGLVALVRNHEVPLPLATPQNPNPARLTAFGETPYDPHGGGGTTTIVFDPKAAKIASVTPSLSGTAVNCAGGPTPWGSWLSCEETLLDPKRTPAAARPHGYIFEVPHDGVSDAKPLVAMGRFWHEAIAVDPDTGIVYETEDRNAAGLYRFIPKTPGKLADGGTLQVLAIAGKPTFDSRSGQPRDAQYDVEWVDIADPDRPHVNEAEWDTRGVFQQGLDKGAATFARLEGAWFGNGRLFVTATNGGDAQMGQVWELDPKRSRLRLVIESPGQDVLAMPDNITLSRRGGLAICEDGPGIQRIHGLTQDGQLHLFARNNIVLKGERNGISGDFRRMEFAGVTYSPDGEWMFVNVPQPGITCAITGSWREGML